MKKQVCHLLGISAVSLRSYVTRIKKCVKEGMAMVLLFLLAACASPDEQRLERALDFAGSNRGELEKVLRHYNGDAEKLEAARFLIRNMPHYYSYRGWQLDTIKAKLSELARMPGISEMTAVVPPSLERPDLSEMQRVYDSHVITAKYLINNIDRAFVAWKTRPWNRTLGFEDFCELILPYRIGNEPITDWRGAYADRYSHLLDSLRHGSDVLEACRVVNDALMENECVYYPRFAIPHLDATFLFANRIGSCRESCDVGLYAMRACGIPVAVDYYCSSPSYQGGHQWLVVRDTTGMYLQFGFDGVVARRDSVQGDGRKKGKVFRRCFGLQKESLERISALRQVPPALADPFVKDVTANYFGSNSVTVPVGRRPSGGVFLGVFAPSGWVPVGIGELNGDSAVFRDIEPGVVYAPVAFADGRYEAVGYPFLRGKSGNCRVLRGDTARLSDMALRRKMPLLPLMRDRLGKCLFGAKIGLSADRSFRHASVLYEFKRPLDWHELRILDRSASKYRYLRYSAPQGISIEFADIAAYSDTACADKLPLRLVTPLPPACVPQNMTDGDILTAVYIPLEFRELTFDLGRMTTVGAVKFCPRTDGNFVLPGDTYELMFHDGMHGWRSLGKRTATGKTVAFRGPAGALFWLRDLTRGREEQVFLYENGRQVFVEDMR